MSYRSLGSKAYSVGKSLGSKALSIGSLGSRMNPVSVIGNAIVKKGIEIGAHKLMDVFSPTNTKRIK
jgi:hypothetical protein